MNLKTGLILNQHDALYRLKSANSISTFSFEPKISARGFSLHNNGREIYF